MSGLRPGDTATEARAWAREFVQRAKLSGGRSLNAINDDLREVLTLAYEELRPSQAPAGAPPDDPSWYEARARSFIGSYEAFDPNGRGAAKYPTEDERKRIVAHLASVLREVREAGLRGVRPSDPQPTPSAYPCTACNAPASQPGLCATCEGIFQSLRKQSGLPPWDFNRPNQPMGQPSTELLDDCHGIGQERGALDERRLVAAFLRGFGDFQPARTGNQLAAEIECCRHHKEAERSRVMRIEQPTEHPPIRCDECDPSYGCFSGASPCSKRPPSDALVGVDPAVPGSERTAYSHVRREADGSLKIERTLTTKPSSVGPIDEALRFLSYAEERMTSDGETAPENRTLGDIVCAIAQLRIAKRDR